MLEVLGSNFIRTVRSRGASEFTVLAKHAGRNSLIPVFSLLGLQVALSWARSGRLRQRLQVEAARDPLTGLLNRRALQAQAARLFAERVGVGAADCDNGNIARSRFQIDAGNRCRNGIPRRCNGGQAADGQ